MHEDYFHHTTIGSDYLRNGSRYPIDSLLDYLSGLKKMKLEVEHNELWNTKYTHEINAVKEILRRQTSAD
jgi:hypothetical protein